MSLEKNIQEFITYFQNHITGDEKGEAQIFLDRLFVALGYPDGIKGADATAESRIQFKTDEKSTTRFADLIISSKVLIEMKKRGEDLQKHYGQAFSYWQQLAPNTHYMILCNFDELWVYDMHYQTSYPMTKIKTHDLVTEWGAISFLLPTPQKPVFKSPDDLRELSQEAAYQLAELFKSLLNRNVPKEQALHFVLQCMVAMFAENIGMLPRYTFTRIIDETKDNPLEAHDLLLLLFTVMNRRSGVSAGRFYDVEYFNGGLFKEINLPNISPEELRRLREMCNFDWSKIRPEIFGTIFEKTMDKDERHDFGVHYTSEEDIRRIVNPVIVRPWADKIASANTVQELRDIHQALCHYNVLDPACGSGNFLYIAYRAMKGLERQIVDKLATLGDALDLTTAQSVNIKQFFGFDIKPVAVEIARVSMMIAKKLTIDELGLSEKALPLDDLDNNIRAEDALFADWDDFDACIGNPPYLGAKLLKVEHGAEYAHRVRKAFPKVPKNSDYCVYWFRKAHELMKDGARAGLVGTNTIRQNYSRMGGLDYIVANNGKIYEAYSSLQWSGEAKVHISIACWSKGAPPYTPARLWVDDGMTVLEVPLISSSLSPKTDVSGAHQLDCNKNPKKTFQGLIPKNHGFVLSPEEAQKIQTSDLFSREVIFPFLIGRDFLSEPFSQPSRFVIDMNQYSILEAQRFTEAFKHVQKTVLPEREAKAREEKAKNTQLLKTNPDAETDYLHQQFLDTWWKHGFTRESMIEAIAPLSRYIVCSRVTKRPIFVFVKHPIRPDGALQVFAFEDDYNLGILQSSLHWLWFTEKGSTLKSDYRYTSNTVFNTFPFPQSPSVEQIRAVADCSRAILAYRQKEQEKSQTGISLRQIYKLLEMPGKNELRELHTALDNAVILAYGFDPNGDMLAQLLSLNETIFHKEKAGESVLAPGIPPYYPNPQDLISEYAISPK